MKAHASGARMLRIATGLLGFLAAYLAFAAEAPSVEAARTRLDDAERRLRSDDVLFAERAPLEQTDRVLGARYRVALGANPEADFVRDLDADARRHGVTIVSSSFTTPQGRPLQSGPGRFEAFASVVASAPPDADLDAHFISTRALVQLRGTYRALLATIAELSWGSRIVRVDVPSLRRDGDAVVATVPALLLRPIDPSGPDAAKTVRP